MNSAQQLVGILSQTTDEIKELEGQKIDLVIQIDQLEEIRIKNAYKDLTIENLQEIWEEADALQRLHILESIPEIVDHVEGLDSHGGLRYDEIISEIADSEWNKCEWLENMEYYFQDYCKGAND